MLSQMQAQGLDFPFFDAVFGAELPPGALDKWTRPVGPFGPLGHGDRACTASHFELLAQFLASDADWLLALEDDAKLSSELGLWLNDLSWVPHDADLVKLEAWVDPRAMLALKTSAQTHLSRDVARLFTLHSGTAGFLISRAHATRVVKYLGKVAVPIDHILFNPGVSKLARQSVIYQIQPSLIRQDTSAFSSDIVSSRGQSGAKKGWKSKVARAFSDVRPAPSVLARVALRQVRLTFPQFKDRCL